jgi:hypothetical protein
MQTFVLLPSFAFGPQMCNPVQCNINVKWDRKTLYTVSCGGETGAPVELDKETIYMKAQVLEPHCFKGMVVCNACTAFRGFFWEGTKSLVDDNMAFDIALKW